jgi:hypothetical protein
LEISKNDVKAIQQQALLHFLRNVQHTTAQMTLSYLSIVICLFGLVYSAPIFHGPTWQNKTASAKQQILWQVLTQDT